MRISLVIPTYNEAEGIEQFHDDILMPELRKVVKNYHVIYVNDGSRDDTLTKLHRIATKDKHISVINLSRNFGKEIATTAGLHHADGDCTIIMDADGQHPPSMLGEFIDQWQDGGQVIVGVRTTNEKEGAIKRYGSKVFYRLFNATSGAELIPRSTDYRLIDRVVREEFVKFSERNRITRGLIDWLGFERRIVEFVSPARLAGEASYSTAQLVRLAINSFISLSIKPLSMLVAVGLIITALSFIAGIFMFVHHYLLNDPLGLNPSGTALLSIFITFLVGLILTSQGILAIYLSHVHAQTQDRPLFVIDTSHSVRAASPGD